MKSIHKGLKKIKFYKNTIKALKKIQEKFLIIIITNQSIIARKIANRKQINHLHDCLKIIFIKMELRYQIFIYAHIIQNLINGVYVENQITD